MLIILSILLIKEMSDNIFFIFLCFLLVGIFGCSVRIEIFALIQKKRK